MSQHSRHRSTRGRGAALVEFAIVAPFLMMMLLGIIEFGRALSVQQTVTTAARIAAREATLPGSTTSAVQTAAADMVTAMDADDVAVDITNSQGTSISPDQLDAGENVTVVVTVPLVAISKMGGVWFGEEATITATSTMRKEGYD